MLLASFFLLAGLLILILGAEGLVRGASSIAVKFNISPLVIGLTVVSFGTSAPELTINLISALQGSGDLAIGNVIGSNIVNILLVLGICAIIVPLSVKSSTVWKEIPLALLGVVLVGVMANDILLDGGAINSLTRTDGIVLLALMVIFMYYIFGMAKNDRDAVPDDDTDTIKQYSGLMAVILTLGGLIGLVVGGQLLVEGAIAIAANMGLSEALIGLTVVAIGTSLPELATSVVAALKKQADIAIGNVVGSNIFNIFFVLAATSTLTPLSISGALQTDILVAIGATFLLFLFMFTSKKHHLTRAEGVLFVVLYCCYTVYLVARG
ncbi:calcium/sodium antiporter [Candidatus Saccharibacteria bacterium]|nr:calcium/sodium antiporter [Candidatus Saccharibacteria bacterium]